MVRFWRPIENNASFRTLPAKAVFEKTVTGLPPLPLHFSKCRVATEFLPPLLLLLLLLFCSGGQVSVQRLSSFETNSLSIFSGSVKLSLALSGG